MTLTALRDDALRSTDDGFALLLGLPWIRSLPVASLADLAVSIDGEPVEATDRASSTGGGWRLTRSRTRADGGSSRTASRYEASRR